MYRIVCIIGNQKHSFHDLIIISRDTMITNLVVRLHILFYDGSFVESFPLKDKINK